MAERLPEGLAEDPPVFVPRLNSERDVENAIIMTVRRLGYNEPTSEQSQAFLRGKDVLVCLYTHGNWEVVVLRQSSQGAS